MPLNDPVRCRAEHAYPGRPLEVYCSGRWVRVSKIIDEVLTPGGRTYRVLCENVGELVLEYDRGDDGWRVIRPGETGI